MNPLQKLINSEMNAQGVKRSELVKRMGYSNVSKGLRNLDKMLVTLEAGKRLLPLLQDALHIPDRKFLNAVLALEKKIFEKKSSEFKPSIWVMYTYRLGFFGAMSRTRFIDVPESTSSLPADQELGIICSLCRILGDKNDISIRKGFMYYRKHGENIELDNDFHLVITNDHNVSIFSPTVNHVPVTSKESTIKEEKIIMKEKYKRRIRQFAEQGLKFRFEENVGRLYVAISDEMNPIITKQIKNYLLSDESSLGSKDQLGSKLQHLGREIAEKIIGSVITQSIPFIEPEMKRREENLAKEQLRVDRSKNALKKLKREIENGYTGKREYWRGAEVIITPTPLPEHLSAFPNDILVVTNTEELAHSVSWLNFRIKKIMYPFYDFRNKYQFYENLANAANSVLLSTNQENDDTNVLLAVLSEAERMREEWLPGLNDYFKSEENLIVEEKAWISSVQS